MTGERSGVVVLGVGRSGTSAVAGMFARAGFFAGRDGELLPAAPSNPRGHFESLSLVERNQEILIALGASWFDPPTVAAQLTQAGAAWPRLRAVMEQLLEQAGNTPLVIKDPRIGVLLALWKPILEPLHPVLVIRHPIEVARSLEVRDNTPVEAGLASWQLHMSLILDAMQGTQLTVVPYGALAARPELAASAVTEVLAHLRSPLCANVSAAAASAAVSPELHHQHRHDTEDDALLTARQRELWAYLAGLPSGGVRLRPPRILCRSDPEARALVRREARRSYGGL